MNHVTLTVEHDCDDCEDTGRRERNVDGADVETFCGMCHAGALAEDDYLQSQGFARINRTKREARS